jgi:hypothetical protein
MKVSRDFINNPVPEGKRGGAIKSKTKKKWKLEKDITTALDLIKL